MAIRYVYINIAIYRYIAKYTSFVKNTTGPLKNRKNTLKINFLLRLEHTKKWRLDIGTQKLDILKSLCCLATPADVKIL